MSPHIHLQLEDLPQGMNEPVVMVLELALAFCAQPETWPVFAAFTQAEARGHEGVAAVLAKLNPDVLHEVRFCLVEGFAAEAGITP